MKTTAVSLQLLAASTTTMAQSQNQSDLYAPAYVDCPSDITVRNASTGLSNQESAWREARSARVITYLGDYLNTANITGFDVQNFTQQLNSSNVPITGLSISGGGTQSGLGGLGIWHAFNSRYPEAVAARTGGLTQILYYITCLSSGGAITVSEIQCVEGFDKLSLIQGTTANAFIAYFIDDFYNVPISAKRNLQKRQLATNVTSDIAIPQNETQNPQVQLVNETASEFDITFNQSLYGTYPNPFQNYNANMTNVSYLLLVDGSLTGETNPIRPLIIPERKLDFIIVYEASSDAKYNWVNGTNLINTANSAMEGNLPFPTIPNFNTMISQNLTKQPTFFGCNDTENTPLVLYLPNSPWTSYANCSFFQSAFTQNQVDFALENAFQLATYGNGTIDPEWPACLACATIRGSLMRLGLDQLAQCQGCYDRHCWSGTNSTRNATAADMNPSPRLNSSLTFMEWNDTIWNRGLENLTGAQENTDSQEEEDGSSWPTASKMALFGTILAFFMTI